MLYMIALGMLHWKLFPPKIIRTQLRHIFSQVLLCLSDSIAVSAFPKFQTLNEQSNMNDISECN